MPQLTFSHGKAPAAMAPVPGIPAGSLGKPELPAPHPTAALPGAWSAGSEQIPNKIKYIKKKRKQKKEKTQRSTEGCVPFG